MRKSVRQNDPGYDPMAHQYEVWLDGKKIDNCHTADEEAGYAVCYGRGEYESFIFDESGENLVEKKIFGKVELKMVKL